ncbi:hypothetical protein D3C84_955070 [compost metagenome]
MAHGFLFLESVGGAGLLDAVQGFLQALLGKALAGEVLAQGDDHGGLAIAAALEGL